MIYTMPQIKPFNWSITVGVGFHSCHFTKIRQNSTVVKGLIRMSALPLLKKSTFFLYSWSTGDADDSLLCGVCGE